MPGWMSRSWCSPAARTHRAERPQRRGPAPLGLSAADRILSSPAWSGYTYDHRGNLVTATARSAPPPVTTTGTVELDAASGSGGSVAFVSGGSGTAGVQVALAAPALSSSTTTTGSLPAGGSTTVGAFAHGQSHQSARLAWTKGLHPVDETAPVSVPAAGSVSRTFGTDGPGPIQASFEWSPAPVGFSEAASVGLAGVWERPLTVTGNGTITATLTWPAAVPNPDLDLYLVDDAGATVASSAALAGNTETVSYAVAGLDAWPASRTWRLRVVAKALGSSFTLAGTAPQTATVDLGLYDAAGRLVAASAPVAGSRRRTLTVASAPAGTHGLRVASADHPAPGTLAWRYTRADHAPLTLELLRPDGTVAATATGASGTLEAAAGLAAGGPIAWRVRAAGEVPVPSFTLTRTGTTTATETASGTLLPLGTDTATVVADGPGVATATLTWDPDALGRRATVGLEVRDGAGAVLASGRSASGSLTLSAALPAAGTYTLALSDASAATPAAWRLSTTVPRRHPAPAATARLRGPDGTTLATASGTGTLTLSAPVGPGRHVVEVAPTTGDGTAAVSVSAPDRPLRLAVAHDGRDHATRVDDGARVVTEDLAPSGRVLRRRVTDATTGETLEDTVFGYADAGDAPAWARPAAGGAPTTYVVGPAGLLAVSTGAAVTWPLADARGDVVGTADATGAYTPSPVTDEWGRSPAPAPGRLGPWGTHLRFVADERTGIVRMGVRLYDPGAGRFLQVDPVEGGSCSDYDCVCGDRVNGADLDGTCATRRTAGWSWRRVRNARCRAARAAEAAGRWFVTNRWQLAGLGVSAACIAGSGGLGAGLCLAASGVLLGAKEWSTARGSGSWRDHVANAASTTVFLMPGAALGGPFATTAWRALAEAPALVCNAFRDCASPFGS
jgi:RHS repeat-associated protein